jgi:hypothetical protein
MAEVSAPAGAGWGCSTRGQRFGEALSESSIRPQRSLGVDELAPLALAGFALAACTSEAPPEPRAMPTPGSVAVTPPGFKLPQGDDCSAKIARYRAVQDNDISMGHVVPSVYARIVKEIAAAESVCAPGHDAEARAMIAASERRHGYPTDL